MYDKVYSLNTLATLCSLVIFAVVPISLSNVYNYDALSRVNVVFPLNLDYNKTSFYSIGLLQYSYKTDDLKIVRNQDSTSVKVLIPKASLIVAQGKTRPYNQKYNINSKGAVLTLQTKGTAQLSSDGKCAKNCQFIFTENKDSENNQMKEAVKEGLFKELQRSLGDELCDKIQF